MRGQELQGCSSWPLAKVIEEIIVRGLVASPQEAICVGGRQEEVERKVKEEIKK